MSWSKKTYKALYDHTPSTSREIALRKDEIVTVLQMDEESGWAEGKDSRNNVGWFPIAFICEVAPQARSLNAVKTKSKKNKRMSTRFFKRDKGGTSGNPSQVINNNFCDFLF